MEYLSTLDDKSRISLPVRIRGNIKDNRLILTKGITRSIWVFQPDEWDAFCQKYINSAAISLQKQMVIQHSFIAPKAEIEIDRAGRITITPSLREYACLDHACKILEVIDHLEIWDSEQYRAYEKANESQLLAVLEEIGPVSAVSRQN